MENRERDVCDVYYCARKKMKREYASIFVSLSKILKNTSPNTTPATKFTMKTKRRVHSRRDDE